MRPSFATGPSNPSRQVPTTAPPSSTATMCSASSSSGSRSASAVTPCSSQNTRTRSCSACSTSSPSFAGRTSTPANLLRVALDVLPQGRFVQVGALVEVGELALGVEEGGARERLDRVEHPRDLQRGVAVARIADGELLQEAL